MDSITRKYPRTFHLPFSPGASKDDKVAKDISTLYGQPLLFTEKMDGSNVCLMRDHVYGRSRSNPMSHRSFHRSFDLLKAQHANVCHVIPPHVEVFGEWLFARHSISYDRLPSYLQIFGVRDGTIWWCWEDTKEMANELGAATVPVILQNVVVDSLESLRSKIETIVVHNFFKPTCGDEREGVVIRPTQDFTQDLFQAAVFKWVRKDHVQTSEHWKYQALVPNTLLGTA